MNKVPEAVGSVMLATAVLFWATIAQANGGTITRLTRATPAPRLIGPARTTGLITNYPNNSAKLALLRSDINLKHFVVSHSNVRRDFAIAYQVETFSQFQRTISSHVVRAGLSPERVVAVLTEGKRKEMREERAFRVQYVVFDAETRALLQIHAVSTLP